MKKFKLNYERIFYILGYLLIITFLLDFGITYYNYKLDKDFFLSHELNNILVYEIKGGKSFFLSITILLNILLILTYYSFGYYYIKMKDTILKDICLIIFFIFYDILIIGHMSGFLSWILLKT